MLRSLAARSLGAAAAASLSSSSSSSSWRARCDGDPYAALGVAKGASKEEIRRAYKVKAAKAHPDHGGDAEEFKRLAAAYATLSDDGKRRAHDAGGGPGGFSFGGGGGGGEREFTDAFRLFEEMFGGGMFAGGGPPGGGRRRRDVRIHPRETALTLTLTDLFDGGEFRVSAPRTVACAACGGRGGDFSECAACRGEGATNEDVRFGNQIMRTRRPCGACGGAGRALERERRCRTCAGSGAIDEPGHAVVVNLKPGARGGTSVRFAGAGDDVFFSDGALAGRRDLVVVVEEAAHADLQRVGDDLLVARRIPLLDALTGFAIRLPTVARDDPRGKTLVVGADARDLPVRPDDVWIVRGEGMRSASGGRGDLLVRFIVEFPESLPSARAADRRAALAPLLGGNADAPAAPDPPAAGLFGGLFGGGGAKAGETAAAAARRASKARVDALYRGR